MNIFIHSCIHTHSLILNFMYVFFTYMPKNNYMCKEPRHTVYHPATVKPFLLNQSVTSIFRDS